MPDRKWWRRLGTICCENDHVSSSRGVEQEEKKTLGEPYLCSPVEVNVGERGVDRAVKHLKRKMASEGILRELKRRRHHMKPSVRKRKKAAEAERRRRKRIRLGEIKG